MNRLKNEGRRRFLNTISITSLGAVVPLHGFAFPHQKLNTISEKVAKSTDVKDFNWKVGIGRRKITPTTLVWLAGYGLKRVPYGKIHDLYVKVMALTDKDGNIVIMATTDNQGMSHTVYESIYQKVHQRFRIERENFMLTFSHNHSGPRLTDDLRDYYPVEEEQEKLVAEYSDWMGDQVADAVGEALENSQPAKLFKGEGLCTFAVNRRDNKESEVEEMIAMGQKLKGAVDHYVPVLAIKGESGNLISVLFGYACHPTTISFNAWSGDYPGFAQINLEDKHPGTAAMFFNACGGDQNPLPRRKLELCKKYGKMLSDAVEEVLANEMEPVSSSVSSAFEYVNLGYEEMVTRKKLVPIAESDNALQARWARRMIQKIDDGVKLREYYPYPVQAWKFGDELLMIGIGGESVVDYSLRFKREYSKQTTWVCGYANEMAAYMPSRRVWEEGGYEGGRHLDEYGHPAWRWAGDVEDKIAGAVKEVVSKID